MLKVFANSVAMMALIAGTDTFAQTTSQTTSSPVSASTGLGEIVVTAQRRAESLQRAAIAVDVVTAKELQGAGIVTASALNAVVPALTVQQGGGALTTFFIRGVGNYTNNGYSDPAIAFNLDGVYLGRPTATTGAFFDLERIEVLKGPQGTLYGRNATGGAINVIPSKPRLGVNALSLSGSYGNYKAMDLEAAVNLAIGEHAAIRVAGKVVNRDGYNQDGTSDENGQAIRAQLLVKPSDALTVRIAGDYSHQGGVGVGNSFVGSEHYTPGTPATATSPANYTYTAAPANLGPYSGLLAPAARTYFSQAVIPGSFINPGPAVYPYLDNTYWGVTGEATLETGIGTLVMLPAYRQAKLDYMFNGPSFQGARQRENDHQFTLEGRLQGKRIGAFDWLIGGYYFDETVNGNYAINQYQVIAFQNFTSKTTSYAGFGRLTAHVSDHLRLVGAARYTKDRKRFNGTADTLIDLCGNAAPPQGPGCLGGPSLPIVDTITQIPGQPAPFTPVPFGTAGNYLLDIPVAVQTPLDKSRVTYRLAAEYDLAPRSLLYASYETGFRSGGFSLAPGHFSFQPEYVEAWTIGSKNRFFNNRVQLNIEGFYWKYRDQQVSHFGLDATGSTNYFTENIGRSTLKGVDVEGEVLVTPTTRLSGNVQYLDSQVKAYTYQTPRGAAALPPVTGCTATPGVSGGATVYNVDCAGRVGYNSPKWSINAGIKQTIALDTHKIVLSGEARYRSNAVIGFDYLAQENSGQNTTFDASASFGAADDRWTITGFVRNITDRAVRNYAQYSDSTGGVITSTYAPPRTYGVRGAVKF